MADRRAAVDTIAEQAAEWLVRLSADDARTDDRAAFEAWKRADPRHAETADRMAGLIEHFRRLRGAVADTRPAHAALAVGARPGRGSRFKRLGTALALALCLIVPGGLALRAHPPAWLLADVRTAPGLSETRRLPDDTRLSLRGASAVNLRFDPERRAVELVRGEILLDVARDTNRPFTVETPFGSVRALGTRFVVRLDDEAAVLTMVESAAAVRPAAAPGDREAADLVVRAGQRVRFGPLGADAPQAVDVRDLPDAWASNQLVVRDAPLPEVLDELARQRPGLIRYDRAALAGIRVSAVLPLGDTDRALRLLSTSHGLRASRFTPWLVVVERQ
jgi:transmembrane sensor